MKTITIGEKVTMIPDYAFQDCSSLERVTIGNSVTSIGSSAFRDCIGLTSVEIPNSVTNIGWDAFSGCNGLTSVEIPNSVTSIRERAFYGCCGLKKIQVVTDNKTYDSRGNCDAIIETATNTLVLGCKNTIIPNNVTSIGDYAFCGCSDLTSLTIPNSVTSIGECAFERCSGLTSVTIGNSVTSIEDDAFWGCEGLTKISVLAKTPPTCGFDVFYTVDKQKCELEVPQESLEAYKSAKTWKNFYNITSEIGEIEADGVRVAVVDGKISINGVADDDGVEIYDINGIVVYRGTTKTIAVPSSGIYIVRVAGKTIKIAL